MEKLQFEEIKENLEYDLYELFDDYIDDIRISILNDDDVIISISDYNDDDDDGVSNHMRMLKTDFNELEYQAFKKILNELRYYAQ